MIQFKIFGLLVQIGKPKAVTMFMKMNEPVCKVIQEDGQLFLADPNGVRLPKQRTLIVKDTFDGPMEVTVTLFANLKDKTKEFEDKGGYPY